MDDRDDVNERADVVVIGGGVMGAAALRYLAERGCPRPVLLESDTLASGSTGNCAGGIRTLFSDELIVRIGYESIRRLERFEEEVRHTISGFYEMSPDHNMIIGAAAEPEGLLYATGFSGHGVPAL